MVTFDFPKRIVSRHFRASRSMSSLDIFCNDTGVTDSLKSAYTPCKYIVWSAHKCLPQMSLDHPALTPIAIKRWKRQELCRHATPRPQRPLAGNCAWLLFPVPWDVLQVHMRKTIETACRQHGFGVTGRVSPT